VHKNTCDLFAAAFAAAGFNRAAFNPAYGLAEHVVYVADAGSVGCLRVEQRALQRGRVVRKLSGEDVAVASDESPTTLELASCGRPPPEVDVRVVQPETRVTCGPNQVGELWIRSASVAKGYWRQPQQTFAAFGVTTAEEEAGGWLRTGDMGFVRGGEIFVCARWKDQVVVGGYVAPLALPVNPQASFQPTDNHSRPSPFIAMPHFTLTLMPSSPWAAQNLIVMLQDQNTGLTSTSDESTL
jgi:acyl-CoA synthetase (AMP-forming)/AMP-acid ligase II